MTLEWTLGFVGAVMTELSDLKAELFTEYPLPPPLDKTADA